MRRLIASRAILIFVLLCGAFPLSVDSVPGPDSAERVQAARQDAPVPDSPFDPALAGPPPDASLLGRALLSAAETDQLLGVERWHAAGFTGHGIRVAIVDTGFDGYEAQLGTGLPARVHAQSFRADGRLETGSEHGTLSARVVHRIAPEAQLYLLNFSTIPELSALVDFIVSERIQVVSFALGFVHNGPGDGTGPVDDIVTRAVDAGSFWSVAAGNWARQHWAGPFTDRNGNSIHEFATGVEDNGRLYRAGDLITVSLRWDEPWGHACTDYDLELFGPDGSLVQAARAYQGCEGNPVESLQVLATRDGRYRTRIVQASASDRAHQLDLLMLGAPDRSDAIDLATPAGSIAEPGDHPRVLTVGALNPLNSETVATFSSRGPTKSGVSKPDIVAPSGSDAEGNDLSFSGTSAATPHAAGVAALLYEAFPGISAGEAMAQIERRSRPLSVSDATEAALLQLGSLDGAGPLLPAGAETASLGGPNPEGRGVALMRYVGPSGYPARFAHLLTEGRDAIAYYRLDITGARLDRFIVGAPAFVNTFELFEDGDLIVASFGEDR